MRFKNNKRNGEKWKEYLWEWGCEGTDGMSVWE